MEERYDLAFEKTALGKALLKKMKDVMNVEDLDRETIRDVEKIVILRVSTKHINLWIRLLEMKRKEISELAGLMMLEEVKKEVEKEKNLENGQNNAQPTSRERQRGCCSKKSTT